MVSVAEVETSCTVSGLDAHTFPMLSRSAGINHVGLCGAHDVDVRLLCPHGDGLPRPMRFVPERASYPIVPHAGVYVCGVRATSTAPCSTYRPGPYASTESPPRLRLGHTIY